MKAPSLQTLSIAFLSLAPAACSAPAKPEPKAELAVNVTVSAPAAAAETAPSAAPAPAAAPVVTPPAPAPSPVAVPAAAVLPNLLANASPAAWRIGNPPPKPWQFPTSDTEITVAVVERNSARWVELKDDATEKSASLRQQFQPLKAGRLSFRIALASDHVGQIGIFLGQGNASAEVERIVELKLDSRGTLLMGSVGKREKTAVTLAPGMSDHLFLEFYTSNEDLNLRLGRIASDGTDTVVTEMSIPQQGHAVSRLRVATDLAPRGSHFYVTDLMLTARPTP